MDMTKARQNLRLLSIACVALLGFLSMVDDAKASPAHDTPRKGVRECCLKRACTVCCCKPTTTNAPTGRAQQAAALPSNGVGLRSSALPCECRSSDPSAPGSRY